MAGISEAIVSLNVVGMMDENTDLQQTAAKSEYSQKKPKPKSKVASLVPRNITGPLSAPKKVINIPKRDINGQNYLTEYTTKSLFDRF